ncbi:MAG: hypothetical protein WAM82_03030 [Thermoanaerobaculia bacterium]
MIHSYRRTLFVVAACALALVVLPAVASAACSASGSAGHVNLPPGGGGYDGPAELHAYLNSGGVLTLELQIQHGFFLNTVAQPGGLLGGERETFDSSLVVTAIGQGPLAGWSRTLTVPAKCVTDTAPHKAGDPIQDFDTNMYSIVGALSNDPDFASFKVVAGTGNGFDSPGHTTAYLQKDGSFVVDSTFQIGYSISYVGSPGGKLAGMSGSTEGNITMTCNPAGPQK